MTYSFRGGFIVNHLLLGNLKYLHANQGSNGGSEIIRGHLKATGTVGVGSADSGVGLADFGASRAVGAIAVALADSGSSRVVAEGVVILVNYAAG
jgi:hypothetical protein